MEQIMPSNSSIELKVQEIKKEMTADAKGHIKFSIRGVGRLCGADKSSLRTIFQQSSSGENVTHPVAKMLVNKGFESGSFAEKGVPDIVCALIVEYYAFDAGAINS